MDGWFWTGLKEGLRGVAFFFNTGCVVEGVFFGKTSGLGMEVIFREEIGTCDFFGGFGVCWVIRIEEE